uniref:Uncharacterized protein n=1 Tax=Aegilops tauschii TaxID=37682 RepID=M8CPQ3_AEGTA
MDWDARMRSALSASRGLAHLHSAHNLAHGNVKSSNVLLRPDYDAAALSDFCLHPIFAPSSIRTGARGHRAPEVVDTRRPTFKADVYSLGVLLLELLTGKSPTHASLEGDGTLDLPRWVQSVVREEWTAEVFDVELVRLGASAEEEMVALLSGGHGVRRHRADDNRGERAGHPGGGAVEGHASGRPDAVIPSE